MLISVLFLTAEDRMRIDEDGKKKGQKTISMARVDWWQLMICPGILDGLRELSS